MKNAGFNKKEHVISQKQINELFDSGNNHSQVAFPLRAIYRVDTRKTEDDEPVQVLVSVSKKRLHHAVDRNRVKRQIREAYRLNKQQLRDSIPANQQLTLAFIWLIDSVQPTDVVMVRMQNLLRRITQKMSKEC